MPSCGDGHRPVGLRRARRPVRPSPSLPAARWRRPRAKPPLRPQRELRPRQGSRAGDDGCSCRRAKPRGPCLWFGSRASVRTHSRPRARSDQSTRQPSERPSSPLTLAVSVQPARRPPALAAVDQQASRSIATGPSGRTNDSVRRRAERSPDGRKIAFSTGRKAVPETPFRSRSAPCAPTAATRPGSLSMTFRLPSRLVARSPQDRLHELPRCQPRGREQREIFTMRADGGDQVNRTNNPALDVPPTGSRSTTTITTETTTEPPTSANEGPSPCGPAHPTLTPGGTSESRARFRSR
jgi:hypothetical protein